MRLSLQDYPTIANLLLVPVQWALIWALPGMGLSGDQEGGQRALFVVLVWAALILEFPAMSLHIRLARVRGEARGLSRFLWALLVFRVTLLLVLGVLALDAVGMPMTHWAVQIFVPVYGIIYVLFCLLTVAGKSPTGQDAPGRSTGRSPKGVDAKCFPCSIAREPHATLPTRSRCDGRGAKDPRRDGGGVSRKGDEDQGPNELGSLLKGQHRILG
jgi:hypothetical protein